LRLSNAEHARLLRAGCRVPEIGVDAPEAAAKAYLYAHGPGPYGERVLLAWARAGGSASSAAWRERLALPARWQPPRFPLGGADVLALGVPEGSRVGDMLRALESWWIAGGFLADESALRAKLRSIVRQAL
jgi:poly(A) polymerase